MTRKTYYYYKKKRKSKALKTKPLPINMTSVRMATAKIENWDYEYLSELFGIELVKTPIKDCSKKIHTRSKGIAAYLKNLAKPRQD